MNYLNGSPPNTPSPAASPPSRTPGQPLRMWASSGAQDRQGVRSCERNVLCGAGNRLRNIIGIATRILSGTTIIRKKSGLPSVTVMDAGESVRRNQRETIFFPVTTRWTTPGSIPEPGEPGHSLENKSKKNQFFFVLRFFCRSSSPAFTSARLSGSHS